MVVKPDKSDSMRKDLTDLSLSDLLLDQKVFSNYIVENLFNHYLSVIDRSASGGKARIVCHKNTRP